MKVKANTWVILLAAALLFVLAGCSGGGQASPVGTTSVVTGAATETTAKAVTTQASPVGPTSVVTEATAKVVTTQAVGTTSVVTNAADEIDKLLALRSVRISLTVDREGEGARELVAEIDAAGNQRILNTSTGAESGLPEEMFVGFDAVQHEILLIDGAAYRQDGEENAWLPAAGLEDYLERSLRGGEGPGLWIKLLSGGRSATGEGRYALAGEVDGAEVTGEIRLDPASGALVQAELEIPGHLFAYSGAGAHYPVIIKLNVEPAEIEAVKLP